MQIRVGFEISLDCQQRTPLLLALAPRPEERHRCLGSTAIQIRPGTAAPAHLDEFGNVRNRLVAAPGETKLRCDFTVLDDGAPDIVESNAGQPAVEALPADALPYLKASRYCESDLLGHTAWQMFAGTAPGWARVQAICDFVHRHVTFGYRFGRSTKTALDTFHEGNGVCRDFAHLAIALCRAMNIPARYVSGYLGDIGVPPAGPGDFCAWFEVYLDGGWYTFDARYNVPRIGRVRMVMGRDAADVPMIASFGAYRLTGFKVWADEVVPAGIPADPPTRGRARAAGDAAHAHAA